MLLPSDCITLRSIKYNDTRAIVHCLSREAGRISIIVNDGNTPAARRRRALMLPGSSFSCIIDIRENRSLQSVREVMPARVMMLDNPVATSIILFACDFLATLLRDSQPDALLYDYVDRFVARVTTTTRSVANAPIAFLLSLQQFMGIAPDTASYAPGYCFDFAAGRFCQAPPLRSQWLDAAQAEAFVKLSRMTIDNMHLFRLTRADRNTILDLLIQYYSTHFGAIRSLQSLPVVRAIFD
ncbi:MAG: hypothetical protein HDS61_04710 [Barnesiella sp.]|nr:hypothetical protein [Barnesiella sp.]